MAQMKYTQLIQFLRYQQTSDWEWKLIDHTNYSKTADADSCAPMVMMIVCSFGN